MNTQEDNRIVLAKKVVQVFKNMSTEYANMSVWRPEDKIFNNTGASCFAQSAEILEAVLNGNEELLKICFELYLTE